MKSTNNTQYSFKSLFIPEVINVLEYGSIDAMPTAINAMYADAFVYNDPTCKDYNVLTFADRKAITEMVEAIRKLIAIYQQYNEYFWKEELLLIPENEYSEIKLIYSSLSFNKEDYLRVFELMVVTSILYKYVTLKTPPTEAGAVQVYWIAQHIKELFFGYKYFAIRVAELQMAA